MSCELFDKAYRFINALADRFFDLIDTRVGYDDILVQIYYLDNKPVGVYVADFYGRYNETHWLIYLKSQETYLAYRLIIADKCRDELYKLSVPLSRLLSELVSLPASRIITFMYELPWKYGTLIKEKSTF